MGSADILAQMADRYYLERLPLLFAEHQEGGIGNYNSVLELMEQTSDFYHNVVIDRLAHSFGNLTKFMQVHFRERWGMERNLYLENIKKNIKYIRFVLRECQGDIDSVKKYLRRIPPD
ncbi:MAG: hypothetical protein ABFS19_13810 [Thermodesulfobacteriota bacterium]